MISYAEKITNMVEPLKDVTVDNLYQMISSPSAEMKAALAHLRVMRTIDESGYKSQKKNLPYFVCAHFAPAFRRTENFSYTEYFVVDIDHLQEKGLDLETVKGMIVSDNRVVLCFVSPSEDGLKIVFRLSEKCYDSGLYSIFYKAFLYDFSMRYDLSQVVDSKTSDVTRACFVSADSKAYFNPDAEPVCFKDFIDEGNPFETYRDMRFLDSIAANASEQMETAEVRQIDPDSEALSRIKQRLNPKLRLECKKTPVYVPQILNEIMPDIYAYVADTGIVMDDVIDIQYGKKVQCHLGVRRAEINIFYGNKRGFSVVETPKCGTDAELNELVAGLIENCIVTKML